MEESYYYHKFDLGKRKVILCAHLYKTLLFFRGLDIGMSICLPTDKYDEERGYNIARAGANKRVKVALGCDENKIDKHIINGVLLGVEKSMRRNPGKYIAGYKKKKYDNTTKDIVQK